MFTLVVVSWKLRRMQAKRSSACIYWVDCSLWVLFSLQLPVKQPYIGIRFGVIISAHLKFNFEFKINRQSIQWGWRSNQEIGKHFLLKFSDAGIQDISTSISIKVTVDYLDDLTERYNEDDESDKHLEARDRRYSCLILRENN